MEDKKMVWKNIIKKLVMFGANYLYNYVDKNDDDKIDKAEIEAFIKDIRKLLNKTKKLL